MMNMGIERKVLIIDGMTCMNCQNRIEQVLKNTAGIIITFVIKHMSGL